MHDPADCWLARKFSRLLTGWPRAHACTGDKNDRTTPPPSLLQAGCIVDILAEDDKRQSSPRGIFWNNLPPSFPILLPPGLKVPQVEAHTRIRETSSALQARLERRQLARAAQMTGAPAGGTN